MAPLNRRGLLSAFAIAPVVIAAPAIAATAPSQIEAWWVEYRAVFDRVNARLIARDDEEAPHIVADFERMNAIERLILKTPCRGIADARAKLRYAIDLHADGMILDGDDAHDLMDDVAKHLL